MANGQLSDSDAKEIMRKWPRATKALFGGTDERPWIRAQPKTIDKHATTPCLKQAGSDVLTTRPDGMWFRVVRNLQAADVFCVEVCGGLQNLQDKRSRYAPSTSSMVVWATSDWWNEGISKHIPRWKKSGTYISHLTADTFFPVRHLRVLFAVADKDYEVFRDGGVAAAHEFFIPHSSLASFNSPKMQEFLLRTSPFQHFYLNV